ncbi:hypothetical protein IMG5_098330 [Ichthyophthirius multifiliis]|uniref:Uncharacterized protein n=1 Tax=Ichthyophthirius multifiliis TaxID=5932 RepID=G0QRX7_ICHMU|nr:hypothetical protein IMG5_098330 [Ichthyophthirius multifiliis]EGR32007.1 hypothetical protein IMG5_098330 [Ichthyophthirius multifiliis]|eukprot:XP_004035493.1 hypothetical protein IMG5_098330 [Ichthyophthirius multifiliis]
MNQYILTFITQIQKIQIQEFSQIHNIKVNLKKQSKQQFIQTENLPSVNKFDFPTEKIALRKVYLCLWDDKKQQFIGNVSRLNCNIKDQNERKWFFVENEVFIKYEEQSENQKNSIFLCAEFVFHFYKNEKKEDLEISIGHILIPFSNLENENKKNQQITTSTIQLFAQTPSNQQKIILQENSKKNMKKGAGWCCGLSLKSKLQQSLINYQLNYINETNDYNILPRIILFKKNQVSLIKAYRQYFAYRSLEKGTINYNLSQDQVFLTFQKAFDCPHIEYTLCLFWENEVNKSFGEFNLDKLCESFNLCMNFIQLLLSNVKYQFDKKDPAQSNYCNKILIKQRNDLLDITLEEIRVQIFNKQGNVQNRRFSQFRKPFNNHFDQDLEEDQEDEFMVQQYFSKRQ